ncbi:MAG: hydrogenase maturation protease [Bacteroidota bacterium]
MPNSPHKILLLGLGNDILGDDAVGLVAARILQTEIESDIDFTEISTSGFNLLETMEGYEYVLLLDAIVTGKYQAGTVLDLSREDFSNGSAISPHYISIPDIFSLAERLEMSFPREFRILAMEIDDPYLIVEGLSSTVEMALPAFLTRARLILADWVGLVKILNHRVEEHV